MRDCAIRPHRGDGGRATSPEAARECLVEYGRNNWFTATGRDLYVYEGERGEAKVPMRGLIAALRRRGLCK